MKKSWIVLLLIILSLGAAMAMGQRLERRILEYPDISGEWKEGSNLVQIVQKGDRMVATCTYGNISWRMEGTITGDGIFTGRLTHTAGVSPSVNGYMQDRRLTLSPDRKKLEGEARFTGGGGHPLLWTRSSPLPITSNQTTQSSSWVANSAGYPVVAGEWKEGPNTVQITQNGGSAVATCTYGSISWRMEATITRNGVFSGRLTHTAGVSSSANGYAQDRRMTLSSDGMKLEGESVFTGGGGHPVLWTRSSPLPTSSNQANTQSSNWVTNSAGYPVVAGEWKEGPNTVQITQNGGSAVATCTYGSISWRMEATITRNGVFSGRLTHTAGVSSSANGYAQDRRMTLSSDGNRLEGQATFTGGGGHPLLWTRSSQVNPPPPPPPPTDQWYSGKKLTWVVAANAGGFSALIDGVSEKYVFGNQSYNPVKARSSDGVCNVLGLMQSAILGNRTINVEIDRQGYILSAALNCDPSVPMPPSAQLQGRTIRIAASSKFDGTIRGAYATTESMAVWIYADGRSAPSDQNTSGNRSQVVRGWVQVAGGSAASISDQFVLACHAAALGHLVRIYSDERGGISLLYLWTK